MYTAYQFITSEQLYKHQAEENNDDTYHTLNKGLDRDMIGQVLREFNSFVQGVQFL